MVFTTNVCFGCSVQFLYSRVIMSLSHMSKKLNSEYVALLILLSQVDLGVLLSLRD
jgi:hypothetical protein